MSKTKNKSDAKPLAGTVWERQVGEHKSAWEAFAHYRDAGRINRSIRKTADAVDKSRSTVSNYAAVWSWKLRADAYDEHVDRDRRMALEAEALGMLIHHAQVGRMMVDLGEGALGKLVQKIENGEPVDITIPQAKDLIKEGAMLERLSRGEPSQIHDGPHGDAIQITAVEKMSDEEIRDELEKELAIYLSGLEAGKNASEGSAGEGVPQN